VRSLGVVVSALGVVDGTSSVIGGVGVTLTQAHLLSQLANDSSSSAHRALAVTLVVVRLVVGSRTLTAADGSRGHVGRRGRSGVLVALGADRNVDVSRVNRLVSGSAEGEERTKRRQMRGERGKRRSVRSR
jgi:hypothetical protein